MTGRVRISGFLWRHQIWPEALKTEILVLSKIYVLYTIRKEILCWSNVPLEPMSENELEKSYTPSKSVINHWRQSFGQGWRRKHEKSWFSCVNDHIFLLDWSFLMRFFGNKASSYWRIFDMIFEVSKIYLHKNQDR